MQLEIGKESSRSDSQNSMSDRKLLERADVGHERRGLITQKGRC